MGFEIGLSGLSEGMISGLGDLNLHIYSRFNIELLEDEKKYAFKDHCSKDNTSTVKGKSATTRYV